jgi:hypothetical protein
VRVDSILLKIPATSAEGLTALLGVAASTNEIGLRAWIIAANGWHGVQDALQTNPNVTELARSRLTTGSGREAQILVGGQGEDLFLVGLSPKRVGKSLRLGIGGEWVQMSAPLKTNRWACRVLLPNGGAVVVESPVMKDNEGKSCLLIFNATAVDALGKPIKL